MKGETTRRDLTDSDGFWVICAGGTVSACSREASSRGVIPGITKGEELVSPSDRPALASLSQDKTPLARDVGTTHPTKELLLEASPDTGYALAHCTVSELFSGRIVQMRFYKSKGEFLASPAAMAERLKGTLSLMEIAAEGIGEILERTAAKDLPKQVRDEIDAAAKIVSKLKLDADLLGAAAKGSKEEETFDASELFSRIRLSAESAPLPYRISFEKSGDGALVCRTDPDAFAGIVILSAAACARASADKSAAVVLYTGGADNDAPSDIVIEATCTPANRPDIIGRCVDLGVMRRLSLSHPVELLAYEELTLRHGWKSEIEIYPDGRLALRSILPVFVDPDRLKHPCAPAGIGAINYYLGYLSDAGT